MSNYVQFTFYTPQGEKIKTTKRILSANWARTINKVGSCSITINPKFFNFDIYSQEDLGLLIETSLFSSEQIKPDMETFWFLRGFEEIIQNKERLFKLDFEDALSLLKRRIVAFKGNQPKGSSPKTSLQGPANVEMKRVFDENLGDLAPPLKRWAPFVTSAIVTTPAPIINKEIPWRNILTTFQQITRTSQDKGVSLFFDLIAIPLGLTGITFDFRTYLNQRGRDRTDEIINTTNTNFSLTKFRIDYNSPNTGYVGGAGKGINRKIGFAQNSVAESGRFTLFETFKSLNVANQSVLDDEAAELVNGDYGKITLEGRLLGNLALKYNFGDRVLIQHREFLIECHISTVNSRVDDNNVYTRDIIVKSIE